MPVPHGPRDEQAGEGCGTNSKPSFPVAVVMANLLPSAVCVARVVACVVRPYVVGYDVYGSEDENAKRLRHSCVVAIVSVVVVVVVVFVVIIVVRTRELRLLYSF